ncbi:MAG: isoleucine--tRNA ligase [Chloroflexi bacterium]|jgi:isoleucyl-tRNA synthetase|nr:isoleucine--tRNA ligase [Chloroflexota bacterium]MBT7081076.1 isoleucine--tRNA ligase [Chloroflexota bacterium]MBT7289487.1 isoleucine--tRNA ligase [Chloroflexota bacterium]
MFKPVNSRVNYPEMEQEVLRFWQDQSIFKKSVESREGNEQFTIFEGPPTANGKPGIHHVLARVFKDILPRYKTMQGYYTPRKAGWDTHGLPVELEVEKELGLKSKPDIEAYGVAEFNAKCREGVLKYIDDWNDLTKRIGYWTDLDHPYMTFDNDYIESCWWILKQLWDKNYIYKGYRVTPHCPRCSTSLSSHEVAQGYKEDTDDPSVFVKFKLTKDSIEELASSGIRNFLPAYLLAWTTTPWTLPGNTALAIAAADEYVIAEVEVGERKEQLILAKARLDEAITDPYEITGTLTGKQLAGLKYEPLFNPAKVSFDVMRFSDASDAKTNLEEVKRSDKPKDWTYPVIPGDFVTMDDGTGIVHIAPAFGEADYQAGQQNGLYFIQPVDLSGKMTVSIPWLEEDSDIKGKFVKGADPRILTDLQERDLLYRSERIKHTYPFCWRCNTPLLYYAKSSWYIKTTAVKDALIKNNERINWYPEHIKKGRFGDWLENNVDWAVSRERYWGTPLPVWQCDVCGAQECVGGTQELKGKRLDQTDGAMKLLTDELDLHRPYVDDIAFGCKQCSGTMHRVPEVIDCWFDSGAMPLSQWHYPFDNDTIRQDGRFPADFICEAVDQTRGWFYSLHAISTLLFDEPSYRNVICLGLILDSKGEKMSKSKKNIVEPWAMVDKYGADPLRWYMYTSTTPGNVRRFAEDGIKEVSRKFLMTLWNTYSFFVMYANIDNFEPGKGGAFTQYRSDLDKWILSELHQLTHDITQGLDNYDPTTAGRKAEGFVDALSNWYIRQSRRRFWKSESDMDKLAAYETLYECLVTLSKLMAPFVPFIAEEIYQNLVLSLDTDAPESVHLTDFPKANTSLIDEKLSVHTRTAMKVASLGRSARSKAGIKVRQPLAKVILNIRSEEMQQGLIKLAPQVLNELNVKSIDFIDDGNDVIDKEGYATTSEGELVVALTTNVSQELADEGMARELVHRIQNMRKSAGFEIADHILTYYQGNDDVKRVMDGHNDYVKQETLSAELNAGPPSEEAYVQSYKIQDTEVILAVKRQK